MCIFCITFQVYNWFSHSTIRREAFRESFNLINTNESNKFHNFVKYSETRWLARANVFKVLVEQWVELKSYFAGVVTSDKSYMAKTLYNMLKDNSIYIYLVAVSTILMDVNRVNLLFQRDSADIFKVYIELYQLLLGNMRLIIKPIFLVDLQEMNQMNFSKICDILDNDLAFLNVNVIDFGICFRDAVQTLPISDQNLIILKEKLRDFVRVLCREISERIPCNITLFQSVSYFQPEHCLNQVNRPSFKQLPVYLIDKEVINLAKVEKEWINILNIKWQLSENMTSEQFWIAVYEHKNAAGELAFENIAKLALSVLSLPLSNATVERIFSHMNVIKSKIRNRINLNLLDSIIRIRNYFHVKRICCQTFIPSKTMYQKFNVGMYEHKQSNVEATEDEETLLVLDEL